MSGAVQPFTIIPWRTPALRRWLTSLLVVTAIWALAAGPAEARRYASIVIDAHSGEVLHADKADRRAYPASLTKMMTLYMLFEALDQGRLSMTSKLKVSSRAAGMPPSKLGLKRGQSIAVRDAIKALVTKSANDVAVVVAEALGGSEQKFARMMTEKARSLGMTRTTFRNASGLPNNQQLSTARDMARLSQALMRNFPKHYGVFSTRSFSYGGRKYKNHNKLLKNYAGTDGIKTGYTHASGFNLAASVVRDGRRLIAIVFGGKTAKSRDRHMRKLLDRNFTVLAQRGVPAMASLPLRKPSRDGGQDGTQLAGSAPNELDRIVAQVANKGRKAKQTPPAEQPKVATQSATATAALDGQDYQTTAAAPVQKATQKAALPATPEPKPALAAPKRVVRAATAERTKPKKVQAKKAEPKLTLSQATGTQGATRIASLSKYMARSMNQGSTDGLPEGVNHLGTLRVVRKAQMGNPQAVAWGVQVGAFRRYANAKHEATKAMRRMPHFLRSSQVKISSSDGAHGPIYHARLVGMTESSARIACGALKAKSMNCVVVPPGRG